MTTIEWTQRPGTRGESWNPVRARDKASGKLGWFCEHVTEGCRNCYAEAMNGWRGNGARYRAQDRAQLEILLDEAVLAKPLSWRKPRTVFVCSMTDLFADFVTDEWLDRIFAFMALTPQHTYQVLTKRPERMQHYACRTFEQWHGNTEMLSDRFQAAMDWNHAWINDIDDMTWPLPNVWLGTSIEDRPRLERADHLRQTPAAVRFLSLEPLLEDLGELDLSGIDWVIAGGESGPNARPAHPDWFRRVRDQCAAAGVQFFFKQWGAWVGASDRPANQRARLNRQAWLDKRGALLEPGPENLDVVARDDVAGRRRRFELMLRLGKKAAGRLLDGTAHDAFPEPAP